MTLPNLKQYIYSALGMGESEMGVVEGKLNIMHSTFLTLQVSPDITSDDEIILKGQYVFRTLFARHFDESMEVSRLHTPPKKLYMLTTTYVIHRIMYDWDYLYISQFYSTNFVCVEHYTTH